MSKCNLLKPLESNTGTFFMFSQYGEDITRERTEKDTYRVTPSKFWALDLNINEFSIESKGKDLNIRMGEIFQNYFDNACAFLRTELSDGKWTPDLTTQKLIQTLEKYKLIKVVTSKDLLPTITELNYIGDINIYAHETTDGVGYNEIYCMIPDEAHKTQYFFNDNKARLSAPLYPYKYKNIVGFENESSPFVNGLSLGALKDGDGYNINASSIVIPNKLTTKALDDEFFNINTIIVFYDIEGSIGDKKVIYKDIPLGIYFTGRIEEGKISNSITKYVANDDIYGQGTSYGLRICTRYLTTANLTMFEDVQTETLTDYAAFAQVMSEIAESQKLMQEQTDTTTKIFQNMKDHLANFKNYKVNVPYLMKVSGQWYWFVNGRNTGVKANVSIDEEFMSQYQKRVADYITTDSPTIEGAINELNDGLKKVNDKFNLIGTLEAHTYNELKQLRKDSALIIGKRYRLTDYDGTIADNGQHKSTHHKFDIVLTASSDHSFSEQATAVKNDYDNYFKESKVENWTLLYDFDNNKERFDWANPIEGHGVIYRMIDEFGNDCPYDFKNIQFLRDVDWFTAGFKFNKKDSEGCNVYWTENMYADIPVEDKWYFTFDREKEDYKGDYSLNLPNPEDGSQNVVCHNNVIKANYKDHYQTLNNIIFVTNTHRSERDYICANNIFDSNCYDITIGSEAQDNYFNYGCREITLSNFAHGNVFGLYCNNLSLGNAWDSNEIKNYGSKILVVGGDGYKYKCSQNIFGEKALIVKFECCCNNNNFGDYFQFNNSDINLEGNTFGKYFKRNNFYFNYGDEEIKYNTFGDNCISNNIYGNFEHNVFGNRCEDIYLNSLDEDCYIRNNKFGDWCRYFDFEGICEKNVFGQDCYNISYANWGDSKSSLNENTLGDHCNKIYFGPDCRCNKFGHKCNNLEFGAKYQYMFFKNNCSNVYFKTPDVGSDPRTYSIIDNCSNITVLNDTKSINVIDDYRIQLPVVLRNSSINKSSGRSSISISSNSSCVLIGTEPENERYNVDKYCPLYANGLAAFLIKTEMKYLEVKLNTENLPNQYYIIHLFNTDTTGGPDYYTIEEHKTYNPTTSAFEIAETKDNFNKITSDVNIHITDLLKAADNHNASFMMIEVGTDNNTVPELNTDDFNWKFGYDDDKMQNLVINPDAKLDKYELDYFLHKIGQKETIYIGGCPVQILPNMEIQFHSMPYDEDPRPTESTGTAYDDTRMIFKINASNDWIEQYKDNIEVQLFRINKNKWTNCKSQPKDIADIEDDRSLYPIENQILSNLSNYKAARGVYYEQNRFIYPYMVYHILRRYIRFNGGETYTKMDLTSVLKQGSPNADSGNIEWDGRHTIQILGTDNSLIDHTNGFAAEFQLRLKLFDRYSEPLRFKLHFGLHKHDGQKLYCSGAISGMNYKTN